MQYASIESAPEHRLRHVHRLNRLLLKVDTEVSSTSPQIHAPRRLHLAHSMRRRSEMQQHTTTTSAARAGPDYSEAATTNTTHGLTRQGEILRNSESRIYHLNKAPGASILTRAKLRYVDQHGWKYWLCTEFPHFVSPLEQMLPLICISSANSVANSTDHNVNSREIRQQRMGYLNCFARPPTEAEVNSHAIRTPEPGDQLVLTHISNNHQIAARVLESSCDLDFTTEAGSRKSRCVLMRIV